jgi:ATP-dependent Clp endopeptidase proteolytic subunit ClpP
MMSNNLLRRVTINSIFRLTRDYKACQPFKLHSIAVNKYAKAEMNQINLPTVGHGLQQVRYVFSGYFASHLNGNTTKFDVISRLLKDRILLLGSEINNEVANVVVSQILHLAHTDPQSDLTLYINSPGGSVQAGLAIFDAMQYVPCDIRTVCFGMAASMGAFLLAAGTKGKRKALPNSRIMIHQPLGGSQGESVDVEISARLILHTKKVLNTYLAAFTDQPIDKLSADTDRDFFMTPYQSKHYGLIDDVIHHKMMIPPLAVPDLHVLPPLTV